MQKLTQTIDLLNNKYFHLTLRLLIGGIFVIAALVKIFDTSGFAQTIHSYGLVPESWIVPLAIIIPYIELATGLMLILNFYLRIAIFASGLMIIVFTSFSMFAYFQTGEASNCGCFGSLLTRQNDWSLLVENFIIFFAIYLTWVSSKDKEKNYEE